MLQLLSLFLPVNAIPQKATAADAALIAIPSSATPTPPKISSTKRTAAPKKSALPNAKIPILFKPE